MLSRLPFLIPIIAICEIFLIIKVGGAIGFWPTVGIVVLTGMTGVWLLRLQGFSLINQVQQKLNRGEMPAAEMMEGVALLMGGVMLITPGFITDIMGLSLILPLSRRALIRLVQKQLASNPHVQTTTFYSQGSFGSGPDLNGSGRPDSTYSSNGHQVIDGEFTEEKPEAEEPQKKY